MARDYTPPNAPSFRFINKFNFITPLNSNFSPQPYNNSTAHSVLPQSLSAFSKYYPLLLFLVRGEVSPIAHAISCASQILTSYYCNNYTELIIELLPHTHYSPDLAPMYIQTGTT